MRRPGTMTALRGARRRRGASRSRAAPAQAAISTVAFTTCADAPALRLRPPHGAARPDRRDPRHRVARDPPQALGDRRRRPTRSSRSPAGPGQAALPFAADAAQIMSGGARRPATSSSSTSAAPATRARSRAPALAMLTAPVSTVIPDCAHAGRRDARALHDRRLGRPTSSDPQGARLHASSSSTGPPTARRSPLRYAAEYPQNVAGARSRLDGRAQRARRLRPVQLPGGAADPLASCAPPAPATGIAHPVGRPRDGPAPARREATVKATYYDGNGQAPSRRRSTRRRSPQVLFTGDDDPVLRADFPAAIAAAADDHYGLLAILVDHAVLGAPSSTHGRQPALLRHRVRGAAVPVEPRRRDPARPIARRSPRRRRCPPEPSGPSALAPPAPRLDASACAYWPFATARPGDGDHSAARTSRR